MHSIKNSMKGRLYDKIFFDKKNSRATEQQAETMVRPQGKY